MSTVTSDFLVKRRLDAWFCGEGISTCCFIFVCKYLCSQLFLIRSTSGEPREEGERQQSQKISAWGFIIVIIGRRVLIDHKKKKSCVCTAEYQPRGGREATQPNYFCLYFSVHSDRVHPRFLHTVTMPNQNTVVHKIGCQFVWVRARRPP